MSRIKTLIFSVLIFAGIGTHSVADRDLVVVFAGCTGRLSAEMEHAWLMRDQRADALQSQRARFIFVLETVMDASRAADALNHRIEAKLAHAAILNTARFGTDPRMAELARQRAALHMASCRTLLLDG